MISLHQYEPEGTPPPLREMGVLQKQEYRMACYNTMVPGLKSLSEKIRIAKHNIKQLRAAKDEHVAVYVLECVGHPLITGYLILRYGTPSQKEWMKLNMIRPKNWEGKVGNLYVGDQVECLTTCQYYDKMLPAGTVITVKEDTVEAMNHLRTLFRKI